VPLESYDLVKKEFDITIIGHITPESEGANLITTGGSMIPLQAQGWNPLMNQ
jgi:thiamine-monophosphate kinase